MQCVIGLWISEPYNQLCMKMTLAWAWYISMVMNIDQLLWNCELLTQQSNYLIGMGTKRNMDVCCVTYCCFVYFYDRVLHYFHYRSWWSTRDKWHLVFHQLLTRSGWLNTSALLKWFQLVGSLLMLYAYWDNECCYHYLFCCLFSDIYFAGNVHGQVFTSETLWDVIKLAFSQVPKRVSDILPPGDTYCICPAIVAPPTMFWCQLFRLLPGYPQPWSNSNVHCTLARWMVQKL